MLLKLCLTAGFIVCLQHRVGVVLFCFVYVRSFDSQNFVLFFLFCRWFLRSENFAVLQLDFYPALSSSVVD